MIGSEDHETEKILCHPQTRRFWLILKAIDDHHRDYWLEKQKEVDSES